MNLRDKIKVGLTAMDANAVAVLPGSGRVIYSGPEGTKVYDMKRAIAALQSEIDKIEGNINGGK